MFITPNGLPSDRSPGRSRKYSNSGYILLGVIIEKVSGLSLADFFKHHLYDRAGMTATALDDDSEVVPNRASGYQRAPGKNVYGKPALLSGVGTGGGGMRSTVGDMLRWQDALLAGRIISLESLMAMTNPENEADPSESPLVRLMAIRFFRPAAAVLASDRTRKCSPTCASALS
jgi:CubicO group peptidase (beta-lactamase class C family)